MAKSSYTALSGFGSMDDYQKGLFYGTKWVLPVDKKLRFSFPASVDQYDNNSGISGFVAFSDAQKEATRVIFQEISEFIDVTFEEIAPDLSNPNPDGSGQCWLITSKSYAFNSGGANPGDVKYITCNSADPMSGTWQSMGSATAFSPTGNWDRIQPAGVIKVPGKSDLILTNDLWCPPDGTGSLASSNYAFIRLRFSAGSMSIGYVDPLSLSDLN